MALTKFFRVAVEGPTTDGRTIDRAHLLDIAATYDRNTYTANLNVEHLRGFAPNPPFNSYGSVAAVKTQEDEFTIGGKKEKRLALYAQFDINDQAKAMNEAGQKLFSSIEIQPNFANSKKAYLVGSAFTDTPASIGTQALKFSTRADDRKENILAFSEEFALEYEDAAPGEGKAEGALTALLTKLSALVTPLKVEEPKPADPAPTTDLAAFSATMIEGLGTIAQAFRDTSAATETRIAKLSQDFAALSAQIEGTPERKHTSRPLANGGKGYARAEC